MHERDATSSDAGREYRERTYRNWQRAASGWDRERDFVRQATRPLTQWLVEAIRPASGDTVLELAAGPGDTSLELAGLVGPTGRVLCTDRSPNMVAAAEREAQARGLGWVECRVLDAEHIDLPDATVDVAVCRMALMLMPDPARVLAELRRICRPAARLGVVVWAEPECNPWATRLWDVLESHTELPPAQPGGPGMFSLSDPAKLGTLLSEAGFAASREDHVAVVWSYRSFDHMWGVQTALNGSLAGLAPTLSEEALERLRAAVAEAMAEFRTDAGGYDLPAVALAVLGTPR
jgi:ubiquinone/menaquinone biosynthesis C-methylase UbiE